MYLIADTTLKSLNRIVSLEGSVNDHGHGTFAALLNVGVLYILVLALASGYFISMSQRVWRDKKKAPLVGLRSIFEPVFVLRLRFTTGARAIVHEGYTKVVTLLQRIIMSSDNISVQRLLVSVGQK